MKPQEKYRLEPDLLGSGGYARVFRAIHKETGECVALKKRSRDRESTIRLRREIAVLRDLRHEHIVRMIEFDPSLDWYTMPVAEGTLKDLRSTLDMAGLIRVIKHIALGLAFAHERDYVHRDVTPRNILAYRSEQGELNWVIADWGLVRPPHGQNSRRITQGRVGTEGFCAPEAWDEELVLDLRADIYSLGRVVAWAMTGKWPGPNIPLIPEGPLRVFVQRTTEMNVTERPRSMMEAISFLRETENPPPVQFLFWWEESKDRTSTTWLQKDEQGVQSIGTQPGVFTSEGEHVWKWRVSARDIQLLNSPGYTVVKPRWTERLGHILRFRRPPRSIVLTESPDPPWRTQSIEDAHVDDVIMGQSRQLSPTHPQTMADDTQYDLGRKTRVIGGLGRLLFIVASEYSYTGGAHGNTTFEFYVFDLISGVRVDELSASWVENLYSSERLAALAHFFPSEGGDAISIAEEADIELTLYRPFYTQQGEMMIELQFTLPESYVGSDGNWSSYTRSFLVTSSLVPEQLKPFAEAPKALLPSLLQVQDGHCMGLSAVNPNPAVRNALEQLFNTRLHTSGRSIS